MSENFEIKSCNYAGCINLLRGKCTLDELPIVRFAEPLQYIHDTKSCTVRRQINIFRTENLIDNKTS